MTQSFLHRFYNSRWLLALLPLLLLPTLFLPLGNDQATFARGGEFLFNGGVLYRDYLDQKPPMIFMYYGLAQLCFGKSDVGIRLFDILWQTGTMLSLFYTIKAISGRRLHGVTAAALYGMLYSSMGYSETVQCETTAAPFIVWMLYIAVFRHSNTITAILLRGGLAGLCFALKFPLGLMLPVLLLWEFVENKTLRRRFTAIGLILAGFALGALTGISPLLNPGTGAGYLRVMEYTREYVRMIPLNLELVQNSLKSIAQFLGDNISLAIVVMAFFGVITTLATHRPKHESPTEKFVQISVLVFCVLLLSVVIERRFLPYHFTRAYPPLISIVSFGLIGIIAIVRENWRGLSTMWKVSVCVVSCMALTFSPFPRYIKNIRTSYLAVKSPESFNGTLQKDGNQQFIRNDIHNAALFISSKTGGGRTFAIAVNTGNIYRELDERPFSRFTMPMYYYATVIPTGAYQQMIEEVRQMRWIIIQKNDYTPTLYGHNKSSWECVRSDSVLYPYLTEHFVRAAEFGALYVYERKDSTKH